MGYVISVTATLSSGRGRGHVGWSRGARAAVADPGSFLCSLSVRRWSQRTTVMLVMLVMQSLDNSLDVSLRRGPFGVHRLSSRQGTGEPNPTRIPEAHDVAKRFAEKTGGEARGTVTETFDVPMTAHILGGAPIGDSPRTGVIDAWQALSTPPTGTPT